MNHSNASDAANWENYRHEMRELLAMLADPERQLAYERDVPIANVPAELICGWFDDLYHPDDVQFRRAFTSQELIAMATFNGLYRSVADELDPLPPTVVDLQAHSAWPRVARAASAALQAFDPCNPQARV